MKSHQITTGQEGILTLIRWCRENGVKIRFRKPKRPARAARGGKR